ncbi:MAG: heparin lyase I family protein, partial [Hyphomicrobiales bacterium]|nr:heparin lyase I family protein [Hyphomicrobiales bacterium]
NLSWEIIGQLHSDDNSPITQSLTADYPVFAFHMTGADGVGGGDYLAIQGFYALSGQTTPTAATPAGDPDNGYLYVSPQPIVRGQSYSIQVEGSFQNNSSGFVEVWVNGSQVVNYHGPIGYGASNYWKEGVYEGDTTTQPITIDYANTVVTATPASPVITGDTVNGNRALLSGTAEANSTVSVYDGSTLLGSTLATSGGNWNYTTNPLSIGAHSITAKVTDAAGNASGASLAVPTTIAAFTGPIVTAVTSSSVSGEAVAGATITFSLAMSSAVTVSGAPQLTLSDGGTATYASGSGTNTLNFRYTVSASNGSTPALAVTGVQLPNGASITDGSGNSAILVGANKTFNNIVVDTAPVSAPVFVSYTANANGSFTIHGTAAPNTTVHEMQQVFTGGDALNLDGTAAVNASGNWTYTTPSLINGTWNGFTAFDENSLGDVSATTTNSGGAVATNMLPSPVVQTTDVNGDAVTLSGVIPTAYGGAGPVGATVLVYDGSTQLGSATTTTGGAWSFTTSSLANGAHSFTVESQNSYGASAPSIPIALTLTSSDSPAAPTISGAVAGQATTSETALKPFSSVTVADPNSGASDTLTITLAGAGGTLSGTGLSGGTGGVYTLSGTAATVTSELEALSFAPNAAWPNARATSTFTLSDVSSAGGAPVVNTTTTVIDNDPSGAISISAAYLAANIDGIDAASQVSSITLIDSGIPQLNLTAGEATVDTTALDKIANQIFEVLAPGMAPTYYVGGNGATGPSEQFSASGSAVVLKSNSRMDVTGSNDSVTMSSGSNAGVWGSNNAIAAGSNDGLWVGGTGNTITVNGGTGDQITGSGFLVNASAAASLTVGGNGSGGTDDLVYGSGVSVTLGTSSKMDVTGSNDSVTVGSGSNAGVWGSNNAIAAGSNDGLWVGGTGNGVNAGIDDVLHDSGTGAKVSIGSNVGALEIYNFGADPSGVINLLNGVGGYTSPSQAFSALTSDGSGGSLLSLGTNGSIDFLSLAPSALQLTNFKIG